MLTHISTLIEKYPPSDAPLMHSLLQEWEKTKPFQGLSILINTPIVPNSLLQEMALYVAGTKTLP